MSSDLPIGTVTFVFTDIEGSTRLLEEVGDGRYSELLAEHHRVCREAWSVHGGVEVDTAGDAFFVAFAKPEDALAACMSAQAGLAATSFRVRMGVHTGDVLLGETGYVGFEVHRAARIAAAAHGGQVVVSQSTASLVGVEGLVDLGDHRFKDLAAAERVYQVGEGEFPPLKSLYRVTLPVPATAFLGRAAELEVVIDLLAKGDQWLLTLTGPGGTGKTRLALQAAAEASDLFPDGVFWVGLASLRDPLLVVSELARVTGIAEQPGRPVLEVLAERLGGRRLLVLLDNAEHLLPGLAGELASLRAAAPTLRLLVTSRERLQLAGEQVYGVPSLEEPEAVQLFCERAVAVGAPLESSDVVRELCARLDHLPLALELAAARTVLFTPDQLLERLAQRLDLLKGGRDADPRQRTLRATIEWSYELLHADEQSLFRRMSVFAGGCTYEAAEMVCDADPETLQSLLDKSLVRRRTDPTGAARYWMLETIREFASGELVDADDVSMLARTHATFVASAMGDFDTQTAYDDARLTGIEAELPNIRKALAHALTEGDADLAHRIYAGAFSLWLVRGPASEGDDWGRRVISAPSQDIRMRAGVRAIAGEFARARGDFERSAELKLSVVATLAPLGDEALLAATNSDLAYVLDALGDHAAARRHAKEAVEMRRRIGDPLGVAHALHALGEHDRANGRLRDAMGSYDEVLRLWEDATTETRPVWTLDSVGDTARRLKDHSRAETALSAALRGAQEMGDKWTTTFAVGHLGQLELDRGAVERAAVLLMAADLLIEKHDVYVDRQFVEEIRAALDEASARLDSRQLEEAREVAERAAASERPSSVLAVVRNN